MVSYMAAHPDAFEEAIKLAISDKQPYAWRAAWLLWSCAVPNDSRIQRHVNTVINALESKNDDHKRELIKMLLPMDLNDEQEGLLLNVCTQVWEKIDKKPSVRFTAFRMIVKIAISHPDLSKEIHLLTDNRYMDTLSSAAKQSIYRLIKEIC